MLGSVKSAVEQMRHFTVSEPFAKILELEQTATRITHIQPQYVPGVLQAPEYAAELVAALAGKPVDDPDVAERVRLRMTRGAALRERFGSENPPVLNVLLNESVLTAGSFSASAMRAQIAHLREIITRYPSVHLAVAPLISAGYTDGRACEVFEQHDAIEATFFEATDTDQITTDPQVGRGYRDLVTSLLATDSVDDKTLAKLGS